MSTQSLYNIEDESFARDIDEYIACGANSYLKHKKYRVGKGVDKDYELMVMRMRFIAFDDTCALTKEDRHFIKERLNKMMS